MTPQFTKEYTKKIEESAYGVLSEQEVEQLLNYIWIFKSNNFTEHWHVNEYITKNSMWHNFTRLRSLNDHGHANKIKGITPKYFAIVCKALNVSADQGSSLEDYETY